MTDIRIPTDLWDSDEQGVITAWLFADGEKISEGTVIAEIMVEKIQYELVSPASGRLTITVDAEIPVSKGQSIANIE